MQLSKTPRRGKRHQLVVALIVLVALLLPGVPAGAIYNGTLDDDPAIPGDDSAFSNVGFVFAERTSRQNETTRGGPPDVIDGNGQGDFCSGVLIAPTLVITAEFCSVTESWSKYAYFSPVPDYDPLYDWGKKDDGGNQLPFAPDFSTQYPDDPLDPPDDVLAPWVKGDAICREPCYRGKVIRGARHFVVLRLEEEVVGIEPAVLPEHRSLDGLLGELVTSVGYGNLVCEGDAGEFACPGPPEAIDEVFPDGSEWIETNITPGRVVHLHERRFTVMEVEEPTLVKPNKRHRFLQLRWTEDGFHCEEDLGGGNFLGTEPGGVLAALTYNHVCDDQIVALRLDTSNARNFLCSKQFRHELGDSPLCAGKKADSKRQEGKRGQ
jgi:hypothetical protein